MSLFPEIDNEIKELNDKFKSFQKEVLIKHKEYICSSAKLAINIKQKTIFQHVKLF